MRRRPSRTAARTSWTTSLGWTERLVLEEERERRDDPEEREDRRDGERDEPLPIRRESALRRRCAFERLYAIVEALVALASDDDRLEVRRPALHLVELADEFLR